MKTFTFLAEYYGGTYISQKRSSSLDSAFKLWVSEELEVIGIESTEKSQILDDFVELPPNKVETVQSVWCFHSLIGDQSLLVNIVETKVDA